MLKLNLHNGFLYPFSLGLIILALSPVLNLNFFFQFSFLFDALPPLFKFRLTTLVVILLEWTGNVVKVIKYKEIGRTFGRI